MEQLHSVYEILQQAYSLITKTAHCELTVYPLLTSSHSQQT